MRFALLLLSDVIVACLYVYKCNKKPHSNAHDQVHNVPVPGSIRQQRIKDWQTLTAAELLVWIGITLKIGCLGCSRVCHYWSEVNDFGNDIIRASMRLNRYRAITSNLTFAPRGTANGWAKIAWLDEILRKACRSACGITQHFAVDESMIKCLSKFCKWIMYMPKKPIKRGIKVFCLVLSTGFVYNWHVYRGKDDPLCGANYMYRLIFEILLDEELWDFCNCVMFCDAAFTSISLFRDLWNKRGIGAVGPINAKKPKTGGGPDSWPHQAFNKGDSNYLPRGWDKTSFSPLSSGGWLQAMTWLDNKFVKILSTTYVTRAKVTVLRYVS